VAEIERKGVWKTMITVILDFISNNWGAFVEHCRQHGIPDNEIEAELEKIEKGGR